MCWVCIRCRPDCKKREMKPPKKCQTCGAFNNAVNLKCRECGADIAVRLDTTEKLKGFFLEKFTKG